MDEEIKGGSLPADIEAERALLGSLLLDGSKVDEVINILKPDDFYDPNNRIIYQTILELVELGKPVDRIIVKDFLSKKGKLDHIGGDIYLTILVERDAAPPSIIPDLAQTIKEKAIIRNLITTAKIIEAKARKTSDVNELIEEAEKLIFDITEQKTTTPYYSLSEVLKTTLDIINELYKKDTIITGLPTGFYELDKLTTGFHKGDLVIIAARPAMGKTSFALSILHNITVKEHIPAAFFSLEMSKEQIVMRLLCNEAKIPLKKIRAGLLNKNELSAITEAAFNMAKAPLYIDDTASLTILDLRAKARRLKKEKDIGIIVVDYLQLLRSHRRTENRQQEVAEISRSLKALAKELEIPVVSLAQLSRQAEMRADKRPQLADLRESGCLTGDSLVIDADTGKLKPIKEMVGKQFYTLSLDEDYKIRRAFVSKVFYSGRKKVFLLKTRTGREIKASANHPFLKIDGWCRLDQLKPGDKIAVPREIKTGNTNIDTIPKELWEYEIKGLKEIAQISWRTFAKELNIAYCGSNIFKYSISRNKLLKIAQILNAIKLYQLATSDILWDEIVSIEELGIEDVYDMTVEETHNFIANDIIVHNSIEQDADTVMFIHRPEYYKKNPTPEEQGLAEIIIAKQRNGPTGTINLAFIKEITKFENLAKTSPEGYVEEEIIEEEFGDVGEVEI